METEERILCINAGSSSIKLAGYADKGKPVKLFSSRIPEHTEKTKMMKMLNADIGKECAGFYPDLIVHRMVHGGALYKMPVLLTDGVLSYLDSVISMAPDHLPLALHLVKVFRDRYPDVPHMACFDTAFHNDLPAEARTYPLSRKVRDLGIVRYGFHGLSFEYLMKQVKNTNLDLAQGRLILAHLGNGASMAAIKGGTCLDTTMGFSPAGGLMMGTRPGDLDPGIIIYLLQEQKLSLEEMSLEINHKSGLLGLSGRTADVTGLLERMDKDGMAARAIRHFCYQAQKYIGMLSAVTGGLDALIFSGGIAENSPLIRKLIVEQLDFLGIRISESLNRKNKTCISRAGAKVKVMVIPTNEEEIMADHAMELLRNKDNTYSYGNWDS